MEIQNLNWIHMNQEQLRTLAYNCGAKPKTEGHMRAITGVYLSYEQLAKFAAGVESEWKDAVLHELIVGHIYQAAHDSNPRKAVQDAITWHVQVALDPLVSSDAQALIDRGAAEERARSQT